MNLKNNNILIIGIPLMIILGSIIFYQYVYLNIQNELSSIKDAQVVKMRTLEKYMNLISQKPDLEKQLAQLKEERKAEESKLIEGETVSLAAANLQEMVKGIITRSNGTISSERVGKPEEYDSFRRINVTIDAVVPDSRALRDIIYSIETQTPFLVIKEVDIRVRNFRDPRDQHVKLDVSALTSSK